MQRRRRFVIVLGGISLLLAVLILTDYWPGLRGPAPDTSEWHWPYELRPFGRWWPALLSSALLFGFASWWLRAKSEARWPLLVLSTLCLGLQLGLIYADRPDVGAELVDRTLSTESNGYFATAAELGDIHTSLRNYPALMDGFQSEHARTHPPGLVVANWLTIQALEYTPRLTDRLAEPARLARCTDLWVLARPPNVSAALWLWSWLPPLAAALVVFPAYAAGRRLYQSSQTAKVGAWLAATLPALLLFSPTTDQLYALLAILSFLWLQIGLQDRRPLFILLSGFVLSLMTFFSLGNVVWGVMLVAYILYAEVLRFTNTDHNFSIRNIVVKIGVFGSAAVSLWLLYWVGWGVAPWAVAAEGLEQHYTLVTSLRRYEWWLGYNLLDFLLFAGPLVVVGLARQAVSAARHIRRETTFLALLLVILLLLLDFSGSARGEVGRLWLPYMPLAALLAARGLRIGYWGFVIGERSWRIAPLLLCSSAPLLLSLAIGFAWRPIIPVILPTPPPPEAAANQPLSELDVMLTSQDDPTRPIHFLGYDLPNDSLQAGETLTITLYWTAERPTTQPYAVFTHLIDNNGALVAQQDNWPVQGQWPPTCWKSGSVIADDYAIQLPTDLPVGRYSLLAGMYDPAGVRLLAGDGRDHILLEAIIVENHNQNEMEQRRGEN